MPDLRRDLGTLESYAILIGILVGAGIFSVTSRAGEMTGPSVILGYAALAPVALASAAAYVVYLSTPLGLQPGGEVLHIAHTFRSPLLAFVGAWLKIVSYLGAAAFLADALAVNLAGLVWPDGAVSATGRTATAAGALAFFWYVHLQGVKWFGRLQVAMCAVLAVALVVLIVPGLFQVRTDNLRPFFTGGLGGFAAALPLLFFAYAGFESLAQSAGEVRDSRERLPRVFVVGILVTAVLFILMSLVAFGAAKGSGLGPTPMSEAAAGYLGTGAGRIVTLGAVMAIATSLNATLLVPARLAWSLAHEGYVPRRFAAVHPRSRVPAFGVTVSAVIAGALLLSGHVDLALNIAVTALMTLYALHSAALLSLPRRNPELYAQARTWAPRWLQVASAWLSIATLGTMIAVHFAGDPSTLASFAAWLLLGSVLAKRVQR